MRREKRFLFIVFAVMLIMISVHHISDAFAQTQISLLTAFPQLTFSQPVGIYSADETSNRLFVVEQPGRIQVFQNSPDASSKTVFLDLTDRLLFGGEQGLLGIAFHPSFSTNGYFYVDYVAANPTRTVISRFTVNLNSPSQANKSSEFVLFEINQPFSNHKGGQLAFGPDGYLYIGMGDGGSEGDPLGNGQNLSTMLGKILRIDVDKSGAGQNYAVPASNPFVGNLAGFRPEIFAYGLRNPWRFSFDKSTGYLWAGDVGQNRIEEIDLIQSGKNYGWNKMEGSLCYNPPSGCNETGLELPVYEYDHSLGYAVIGGYVYHGQSISTLAGKYVYGDYGSGRIWGLTLNGTKAMENNLLMSSGLTVSSFGEDQQGELYICAFDGRIYKIVSAAIPEIPFQGSILILMIVFFGVAAAIRLRRVSFPGR